MKFPVMVSSDNKSNYQGYTINILFVLHAAILWSAHCHEVGVRPRWYIPVKNKRNGEAKKRWNYLQEGRQNKVFGKFPVKVSLIIIIVELGWASKCQLEHFLYTGCILLLVPNLNVDGKIKFRIYSQEALRHACSCVSKGLWMLVQCVYWFCSLLIPLKVL